MDADPGIRNTVDERVRAETGVCMGASEESEKCGGDTWRGQTDKYEGYDRRGAPPLGEVTYTRDGQIQVDRFWGNRVGDGHENGTVVT